MNIRCEVQDMGRFQTRTNEFTIEDVNQWLEGSSEAETKIWIDCQFLYAMEKIALKSVTKSFLKSKKSFILNYLQNCAVDLESISMDTIIDVMVNLRNNPKTFVSRPKFIAYIKETSFFRLKDKLETLFDRMQRTYSYDRVIKNSEDDSSLLFSDILLVDETTPFEHCTQQEIHSNALLLISSFKESTILKSKKTLKNHLCILVQVTGEEKTVVVVIFLWKDYYRKELRKEAQKRALYHQQTWSSYNRRLRFHFKEFIQTGKGQEIFNRLVVYISIE